MTVTFWILWGLFYLLVGIILTFIYDVWWWRVSPWSLRFSWEEHPPPHVLTLAVLLWPSFFGWIVIVTAFLASISAVQWVLGTLGKGLIVLFDWVRRAGRKARRDWHNMGSDT